MGWYAGLHNTLEEKLTYSLTGYDQQRKSNRAHYPPRSCTRALLLSSRWKPEKDEATEEFIGWPSPQLGPYSSLPWAATGSRGPSPRPFSLGDRRPAV